MKLLLTERQKFILKDLLYEEKSITAKTLAKRYNVSLRTVRYDLDNVEYWLNEKGITLIKVPRVGIMVKDKVEALKAIKGMKFNANEVLFSSKDRENIILLKLILTDKPLISEKLAEELYVSRSTIITSIKKINQELKEYFIYICGKTNHGFLLSGEERDIRRYVMGTFIPFMVNTYKEKLYSLCEELLSIEEINMADNAVLLLRKYANMRLNDIASQILKFKIISLIRRIRCGNILSVDQEEITRYKSTKVYAEAKTVYMYLVENYDLLYEEGEIAYLSYIILTESTDINPVSETDFDEEKLLNVVAEIVNVAFNQLNIRESEIETLSKELFSHLKITLNRFELNIISENPILEQIKAKYGDVFEVVKKASAIFKNEYGFELSEDEIGFITMYFLKSLEKSKTHIKKNIIVVCNTSRGTSKLLATRIKNNITEVNIKNIVSIIDIENDKELLEDIDLIISTIKISNIGKPTITVSPIITNYELTKIRDFLYLKDEYVSGEKDEKNYIDDTLTSIIEKYTQKKNVGKLHREIMSLMGSFSNIMMNDKEKENYSMEAELTGLILVEISDMILRLYPSGINQEEFKKVCGIMIHIVMAIPRWQKGEYNPEKNIKGYEQMYPERFKIIEETFNRISDKYKIFIKRTEIVAILRYMI